MAARLIAAAGGRPEQVRDGVEKALAKLPKVQGQSAQVYLSSDAAKLLKGTTFKIYLPLIAAAQPG